MPIFRKKPLAVIGGGDSAVEEATYLTKYGSKVFLIVRRDKLRASAVMQKRALTHPKVRAHRHAGGRELMEPLTTRPPPGPPPPAPLPWPLSPGPVSRGPLLPRPLRVSSYKVEIIWNTVAEEALGDGNLLSGLRLRNVVTKEATVLPVNGLFYAIGHTPNTDFLKGKLDLDEDVRGGPRAPWTSSCIQACC